MMKNKIPLIIAIVVIIILAVAIIIFGNSGKEKTTSQNQEANLNEVEVIKELYGLSGEIKAINGNVLSVYSLIPLSEDKEPVMATAKVVVGNDTKIFKLVIPEEGDENSVPNRIEMPIEELNVGNLIDIISRTNSAENVQNQTEFTPTTINVVE